MTPGRRKRRNKKILAKIEKQLEAQWNADTEALHDILNDRVLRDVYHETEWRMIWDADHEAHKLIFRATRPHTGLNSVTAIIDRLSRS